MKLYCDDGLNVLKTLPDKSIDLIVVDPPYDIHIDGGGEHLDKSFADLRKYTDITEGYDIIGFGTEFMRVMKTPNIYIWCSKKQIIPHLDFYVKQCECAFDIISWHKSNAQPLYSNKYMTDTEYCLYFHIGNCAPQNYEDARTWYTTPLNTVERKEYGHPTIKPVPIIERFIRNSSKEGDLVLDCFMGSGTTGVACKNLNRDFIGVELSPEYFELAKTRIGTQVVDNIIQNTGVPDNRLF